MKGKFLMIHSYKGGTGKTALSLYIAKYFADKGKKVLLIDADFQAPSLFSFFPKPGEDTKTFNDYLEAPEHSIFDCIYPSVKEKYDVIFSRPPETGSKVLSTDTQWHRVALARIIHANTELSRRYDLIIYDTGPGLNLMATNILAVAEIAIIVVRPNDYSVMGTLLMLKEIYSSFSQQRKDFVLFNQVPPKFFSIKKKILNNWLNLIKDGYPKAEILEALPYSEHISTTLGVGAYNLPIDVPQFREPFERNMKRLEKLFKL